MQYDRDFKKEAKKYKDKITTEVKNGKRGSAYSLIRRLGDGPDDHRKSKTFSLPVFVDNNMSTQESANLLAEHFSKISQMSEPISIENCHPRLKDSIEKGKNYKNKPILEEYQVFQKLLKAKKPKSSVPGDIPRKIMIEFTPEFSAPVTRIFNKITLSSTYPADWLREYQTPFKSI